MSVVDALPSTWQPVAKAIAGTLLAAVGSVSIALADTEGISTYEWLAIVGTVIATAAGIHQTPNQRTTTRRIFEVKVRPDEHDV